MSEKNQELEAMRVTAERAGLVLSEEELAELSVGVKRNQAYAEAVRRFLHSDSEPGTVFGLQAPSDIAGSANE